MSRVFEALNKASHEKSQTDTKLNRIHPLNNETVAFEGFSFNGEHSFGTNGYTDQTRVPPTNGTTRLRSWREKLEELCFGWDLRRYATHPIVALEEESSAAEQYKILREQFKRLRTESGIRTIAITSPVKKDGKTTVAVNLAASIALDYEQKVLLIDGDLRAPSVHRFFKVESSPGLTEYLSSNSAVGVKSLIRDTHFNGLQVIPAGKPSRFSAELLAKDRMTLMLDEIHNKLPGHMVIIDSPPVLATSDPMVLSRYVDGVMMVIRAGKTPKEYLSKALGAFNSGKVLGIVLNGADYGLDSKYYYYSSNGHG
jgi:capsular exopolysaccharide synthesis family protein